MRRIYRISVLLLLLASWTGACKNAATSTNNQASPGPPPAANSNAPNDQPPANNNTAAEKSSGAPAPAASNPSKLFGTYAMSEVHSGGVVNMISQMKTQITFLADGTYSRISMRKGNVYHSDAGNFRVEGNDQLVLLIKFAKQKVHNPPLERRHSFTLSRDGEELTMTSDDGKVAVFRKIKKA
ncbi:MAG: hypothetical protein ACLGJB_17630 [Blastocatellia bacterium]